MHASLVNCVLREAKVQAFKPPLMGARDGAFRGGVVLDNADSRLRHWRYGAAADCLEPDARFPNRMSGQFSYGGFVYHHFGHFLSEMVHRIVPSRLLCPNDPFVFIGRAGTCGDLSFEMLPPVPRNVLVLLGLAEDECRFVTQNTVVESLLVVEQGSELGLGPKSGYLDDLHDYITPRLDALHRWDRRPNRVYVSRGRMHGGLFLGERYLEEQLVAEGFSIVHPEILPISVQMDIYRKAEILVFVEGSACHGVELLGTGALQRCYLLIRREPPHESIQKILQPGAAEFAVSAGHPYIGTRFVRPHTKEPVTRLGVNLFNPAALLSFFRSNDVAQLPLFSDKRYFETAELDLLQYRAGKTVRFLQLQEPSELNEMLRSFLAARDVVGCC